MQTNDSRSLSIIVPALNEAENISSVIEGLVATFQPSDIKYEILLFDDGSIDDTYEIACSYAKENKNVRVFKNVKNRGIGYCFREGIRNSRASYVTFFPGDNQNYPDDLYRLSQYLPRADVIVGVPYYKPGERSLFRRVLSKALTTIFTSFIPLRLEHVTNTVFYSKDLVSSFNIRCNGFMFQIEVLLKAFRSAKAFIISKGRVNVKPRIHGSTKALRLKTLLELLYLFFILVEEFYLTERKRFKLHKDIQIAYE